MQQHSIVESLAFHACSPLSDSQAAFSMADGKRVLTYREAWQLCCSFAEFLKESGHPAGSAVTIQCTQDTDFILSILAVQLAGLIAVPLEKGATEASFSEIFQETEAVLHIGARAPKGDVPFFPIHTIADLPPARLTDPEQLRFPGPEEPAEILFSTGTTGKSKGILLTHGNNAAIAENIRFGTEMKKDNLELIPMPLSHSHGLRTVYANLQNGSGVAALNGVLMMKKIFNMLDDLHCTAVDKSPSMLAALFRLSGDRLREYRDKIDYVELGSAPTIEEDKERLCRLLPESRLYNFYGSTESGRTCVLDFNRDRNRPACIGKPSRNAVFLFTDRERREIQATKENPGLIATAGPQNMAGYFHAPELTASVLSEGILYTNDLGYQDEDGYIYCLGREDDVINCAGIKISPEEIETEAARFEGVSDCACVPESDPVQGQVPKLFISLSVPEEDFDSEAFRRFLKTRLNPNKVPKKIEVIGKIPRTSNGKLRRKELH